MVIRTHVYVTVFYRRRFVKGFDDIEAGV